jgi:hypothetical protein
MTTDQIISKELPESFRRALDDYELRESDTHDATNAALLTEFQQAQLDAINRFLSASEEKAKYLTAQLGADWFSNFRHATIYLQQELNEQAK